MTKEQAIEVLNTYYRGEDNDDREFCSAIDMAIKALEQETVSKEIYDIEHFARKQAEQKLYEIQQNTSDDCVSRAKAIEWIENLRQMDKCFGNYEDDYFPISEVIDRLKNAPPVTSTRKVGKWIEERDDYGNITRWHCSNCYDETGFITTCAWDYCPNCGAEMRGSEND